MDPPKGLPVSVISTRHFDNVSISEINPPSISYNNSNIQPWESGSEEFEFSNKSIRLGFLRKIYGILTLQLIFTFGIVALVTFQDGIKKVFHDYILYFALIPLGIVALLTAAVFVKKNLSKMAPFNYIILVIFTILTTISVSALASFFEGAVVLAAGGITLFVTFSVFLYTLQSKWNITFWGGLILTLCGGLLMSLIMYFILPDKDVTGYKIWGMIVVSLLLSLYIALMIFGTMEEYFGFSFDPEEYIQAIFKIYLGTLIIFIIVLLVLALVGGGGKDCSGSGNCTGCYWGACYCGGGRCRRNSSDDEEESRT